MRTSLLLSAISLASLSQAQFYPEAKAYWRGVDDNGGPPFFNVGLVMPLYPDTLINGITYKRIRENNDASGSAEVIRDHYVRSAPDGKGYVYIPDSAAEFLTGDLNAQAGDTVRDVLVSLTTETDIHYMLTDVIIDSVIDVLVGGIPKTRCYGGGSNVPHFWQTGMGTISGPMLEITGQWWYCCVNDTLQSGSGSCPSWSTDVSDLTTGPEPSIIQGSNPSTGLFELRGSAIRTVEVRDMHGRLVIAAQGSRIDLSDRPAGVYTATVINGTARRIVRLVVER